MRLIVEYLTQNNALTLESYERILVIMIAILSSIFVVIIAYDFSKKIAHQRALLDDTEHFLQNGALKDIVTEEHSQRVSDICYTIARAMGLSKKRQREVKLAGLVHDVGKIGIPDAILNKKEKLSDEEWAIIRSHSKIGYNILSSMDKTKAMARYSLQHHERIDGKGYPNNIKGSDIALYSKIITIADAYDAMTSDRPYRKAMTKEQAINELVNCSGTQFDSGIVKVFTNAFSAKN